MSVKKMIEIYVSSELAEQTWAMLLQMYNHGIIGPVQWRSA